MNKNKNGVRFGAKQEAIITPKEGYEVVSVEVINTDTKEVVLSELKKSTEHPGRCICTFVQPSANVVVKPTIKPILYSITIEASSNCSVVFVEEESLADIEINDALEKDSSENNDSTFNCPQHSVKDDTTEALNVGVSDDESDLSDIADNEDEDESEVESSTDVMYDSGSFSDVIAPKKPTVMTQKELDKKNEVYWQWKREFDEGRCTKEKFNEIHKRHRKLYADISAGRVIVK